MSGESYPGVTIYTTRWCGDCMRSKRLLDRWSVPYEEIDIERVPEAAQEVMRLARGYRSVPVIKIENGPVLVEPSDRELAAALELPLGAEGTVSLGRWRP